MLRTVWFSIRLGLNAGISSGAIIGLIAGLGGSAFTKTLSDLASFAAGAFWLLLLALPLVYARNLSMVATMADATEYVRARIIPITMIAWLVAYLSSVVAFMIPVVIVPLVFNKGVNLNTSVSWYDQVYSRLLAGPAVLVAIGTAIGFTAVVYLLRQRTRAESV